MASQAIRPKMEEKSTKQTHRIDDIKTNSNEAEKPLMFSGRPATEWKEVAADRLVKGADWLAGATSRLSDRIATVATNDHVRENAVKAVGLVTGAGALLAQQAGRIKPIKTYQATAQFARRNPKMAVAGGVVTAAALYGAYRAYRNAQPVGQSGEVPYDY
jgi:ElaB/YqjD/DUF883 family membrane-anchored ribosome-binding protein